MAMGNLSEETANLIVSQAEERAEQAEAQAAEARRQKREQDRLAEMAAEAGMKLAPLDEEAEPQHADDFDAQDHHADSSSSRVEVEVDGSERSADDTGNTASDESSNGGVGGISAHERTENST